MLTIVVVHPPKDSTERRLARNGILTLNDGADTGHWGNKSDGWCIWRDMDGPTILNVDKLKDHETMGHHRRAGAGQGAEPLLRPAPGARCAAQGESR